MLSRLAVASTSGCASATASLNVSAACIIESIDAAFCPRIAVPTRGAVKEIAEKDTLAEETNLVEQAGGSVHQRLRVSNRLVESFGRLHH